MAKKTARPPVRADFDVELDSVEGFRRIEFTNDLPEIEVQAFRELTSYRLNPTRKPPELSYWRPTQEALSLLQRGRARFQTLTGLKQDENEARTTLVAEFDAAIASVGEATEQDRVILEARARGGEFAAAAADELDRAHNAGAGDKGAVDAATGAGVVAGESVDQSAPTREETAIERRARLFQTSLHKKPFDKQWANTLAHAEARRLGGLPVTAHRIRELVREGKKDAEAAISIPSAHNPFPRVPK